MCCLPPSVPTRDLVVGNHCRDVSEMLELRSSISEHLFSLCGRSSCRKFSQSLLGHLSGDHHALGADQSQGISSGKGCSPGIVEIDASLVFFLLDFGRWRRFQRIDFVSPQSHSLLGRLHPMQAQGKDTALNSFACEDPEWPRETSMRCFEVHPLGVLCEVGEISAGQMGGRIVALITKEVICPHAHVAMNTVCTGDHSHEGEAKRLGVVGVQGVTLGPRSPPHVQPLPVPLLVCCLLVFRVLQRETSVEFHLSFFFSHLLAAVTLVTS
mmetsp:Transcript_25364/g.60338  ORF Transcript_25364/g.60338 Transcript_25364/m.60338 type:complete len:269 (+) Transcript_25364:670-1476(+)